MSILFLSISTSALVKGSLPPDSKQQPWIVRMAAQLADADGIALQSFSANIRAGGRKIEPGASAVHGITSTQADRSGVYELFALGMICGLKAGGKRPTDYPGLASEARTVICWNDQFVRSVISNSFARLGEPSGAWMRPGLQFIGLQQIASTWCRLPGDDGAYRLPKRDEAAALLLGLPERRTPVSCDSNLDLEKLIYFWLREHRAFEATEAA